MTTLAAPFDPVTNDPVLKNTELFADTVIAAFWTTALALSTASTVKVAVDTPSAFNVVALLWMIRLATTALLFKAVVPVEVTDTVLVPVPLELVELELPRLVVPALPPPPPQAVKKTTNRRAMIFVKEVRMRCFRLLEFQLTT